MAWTAITWLRREVTSFVSDVAKDIEPNDFFKHSKKILLRPNHYPLENYPLAKALHHLKNVSHILDHMNQKHFLEMGGEVVSSVVRVVWKRYLGAEPYLEMKQEIQASVQTHVDQVRKRVALTNTHAASVRQSLQIQQKIEQYVEETKGNLTQSQEQEAAIHKTITDILELEKNRTEEIKGQLKVVEDAQKFINNKVSLAEAAYQKLESLMQNKTVVVEKLKDEANTLRKEINILTQELNKLHNQIKGIKAAKRDETKCTV